MEIRIDEGWKTSWLNWVEGKITQQRGMEAAAENSKESSHSAYDNEWIEYSVILLLDAALGRWFAVGSDELAAFLSYVQEILTTRVLQPQNVPDLYASSVILFETMQMMDKTIRWVGLWLEHSFWQVCYHEFNAAGFARFCTLCLMNWQAAIDRTTQPSLPRSRAPVLFLWLCSTVDKPKVALSPNLLLLLWDGRG